MQCTLCGAANDEQARRCSLCDQPLDGSAAGGSPHLILDPVDLSRPTFIWPRVALAFLLLFMIALPWAMMSDLFRVPSEVKETQSLFKMAHGRYRAEKSMWDERKDQVIATMQRQKGNRELGKEEAVIQDVPFEVVLSYLEEELHFFRDGFRSLSVYPLPESEPPRLIISKEESSLGILSITSSMEVELTSVDGRFVPAVVRLRRGEREVPQGLAWVYFGSELQAFRRLEMFRGGIQSLALYDNEAEERVYFSYQYDHRELKSAF